MIRHYHRPMTVYLSHRVVALFKSPTTVVDVITTELPRPRDQIVTKALRSLWCESLVFGDIRVHGLDRMDKLKVHNRSKLVLAGAASDTCGKPWAA